MYSVEIDPEEGSHIWQPKAWLMVLYFIFILLKLILGSELVQLFLCEIALVVISAGLPIRYSRHMLRGPQAQPPPPGSEGLCASMVGSTSPCQDNHAEGEGKCFSMWLVGCIAHIWSKWSCFDWIPWFMQFIIFPNTDNVVELGRIWAVLKLHNEIHPHQPPTLYYQEYT